MLFRVIKWRTEEITEKITITPDADKTPIIQRDLLDLDMVQIRGIRPGDMAEAPGAEVTTKIGLMKGVEVTTKIGLMKGVDGRSVELNITLTVCQLNTI